jgi:hypothetical protein
MPRAKPSPAASLGVGANVIKEMIRFLIFILSLLVCSSCCDTSQGCCGDPPNPELTPEAKSWLGIYQQKGNLIFEDQDNRRDTLLITFETDTEYCGGDECGSDCKIQRAFLESKADPMINLSVTARYNEIIEINERISSSENINPIHIEHYSTDGQIFAMPDYVDVELIENYLFQGQEVTAIRAQCNNVNPCEGFPMSTLVVSKEKGLLEFVDYKGINWKLIE